MGFNSVCAMMNAMLFAHKRQLASAHNKQRFVMSRCWWPVKRQYYPTLSIIYVVILTKIY